MKDSEKGEDLGRFLEPAFDLTEDINGTRDGIADIRKGVASLFLKQNAEGTQLIGDGVHYIQESVSRMREKLNDEEIASSEGCARVFSGIKTELEAAALLKEGLKGFRENHFEQGMHSIVQGLFLAENGLDEITEGGKGFDLRDRRKVIRNLRKNIVNLQTGMRDIADGLDDIQTDSIEEGVSAIGAATENISSALGLIEGDLQLLCDEDPEHLRLMIEGIQAAGEGQAHIRSGLAAISAQRSDENCPVCLCIEQIDKALLHLRDGIRDMKRSIQLLLQSNGRRFQP